MAQRELTGSTMIATTRDQLGSLLGIGRAYVSRVVRRMKEAGSVQTRRGGIVIRDQQKLEQASCDCNHLVAHHFDMVLGGVYPNGNGNGKGGGGYGYDR